MLEKDGVKLIATFVDVWIGRSSEKRESQIFWYILLSDVLGVENPTNFIKFEAKVVIDNTSFIDGYISSTKVLIEQYRQAKSKNRSNSPVYTLCSCFISRLFSRPALQRPYYAT